MRSMIVQLTGVNFINKGAEAMMRAAEHEVANWDETEAVATDLRIGSFEQRRDAGLSHMMMVYSMKFPQLARALGGAVQAVPEPIRRRWNWVAPGEVDLALDASGFALSDQWGTDTAERLTYTFEQIRYFGGRIVMLPQAFGPFTRPDVRAACRKVLDLVDFVYAREQQSYDYLLDLGVPESKADIAPDFTNLLHVAPSPVRTAASSYACVVPNYRMVDMTEEGVEDAYMRFLKGTVRHLAQQGFEVRVVLHTTNPLDRQLAETVCADTQGTMDAPRDALVIKRILGGSELVVSSRFHGLVNALTQGVPAAATGWSHKYEYLMDEYDSGEYLISMDASPDEQRDHLQRLIDNRSEMKARVEVAGERQRERTRAMWSHVRSLARRIA